MNCTQNLVFQLFQSSHTLSLIIISLTVTIHLGKNKTCRSTLVNLDTAKYYEERATVEKACKGNGKFVRIIDFGKSYQNQTSIPYSMVSQDASRTYILLFTSIYKTGIILKTWVPEQWVFYRKRSERSPQVNFLVMWFQQQMYRLP